jgi:hypothetical protein
MRNTIICTLHQIVLDVQIKEDEMGGTYSMHVGDEKCIQNFVGNPEENKPFGRSRYR